MWFIQHLLPKEQTHHGLHSRSLVLNTAEKTIKLEKKLVCIKAAVTKVKAKFASSEGTTGRGNLRAIQVARFVKAKQYECCSTPRNMTLAFITGC